MSVEIIPLLTQTREEQLAAEVLRLAAELAEARAQLDAQARPPTQRFVALGGGIVAEADGRLWMEWRDRLLCLGPSTPAEADDAATMRAFVEADLAQRMERAS